METVYHDFGGCVGGTDRRRWASCCCRNAPCAAVWVSPPERPVAAGWCCCSTTSSCLLQAQIAQQLLKTILNTSNKRLQVTANITYLLTCETLNASFAFFLKLIYYVSKYTYLLYLQHIHAWFVKLVYFCENVPSINGYMKAQSLYRGVLLNMKKSPISIE